MSFWLAALASSLAFGGGTGRALDACGPEIAGIDELGAAPIVVLGEVHGMTGQPAFVADLACRLAVTGRHVVVALEVGKQEQDGFDAFLNDPADARVELLRGRFWTSKMQCGIASVARAEMLESIRGFRQRGLQVRVVGIDDQQLLEGVDPRIAQTRDAVMAENLLSARRPGETMLALVGNLHARASSGTRWMAALVKKREPRLLTLDNRYLDGEAWNCQPDMDHCGIHPTRGTGVGEDWRIEPFPRPSADGYDGVFQIGKAVASPPAVDRRSARHP